VRGEIGELREISSFSFLPCGNAGKGLEMKHFSEEDWTDFARGIALPELAAALQQHLDSGCKECLKINIMWRDILDIARDEAGPPPPDGALRAAKACYRVFRISESTSRVPTLAELVFDSFRQPAAVGLRSSRTSARQFLYKSEGVDVDIHTRFDLDSNRVLLTGQILDPSNPDANMKDISVMLIDEREMSTQAMTNASGEFQLEFDRSQNAWLKIDRWKQRPIVMVLRDLEPMKKSISSEQEGDPSKDARD
jgi:hypothetical protein